MISDKEFLTLTSQLEQQFDVSTLTYNKEPVWPLIRILLYTRLRGANSWDSAELFPVRPKIPVYQISNKQLRSIKKDTVDILFFCRPEEHHLLFNRKRYNPYIDPVIAIAKRKYRCVKLEFKRVQHASVIKRIVAVVYRYILAIFTHISTQPVFSQQTKRNEETSFIVPSIRAYAQNNRNVGITAFSKFNKEVQSIFNVSLNENFFLDEIALWLNWSDVFSKILSNISPRAVFLTCYYYPLAMGLIHACKTLKIPTVDIQHGVYSNYHGAYTHWHTIPAAGYSQLPDYYLCWGVSSLETIKKWYPVNVCHHQPVVGGNAWLTHWLHNEDTYSSKKMHGFYKKLDNYSKTILITMQIRTMPLAQFVFDAMKSAPKDWLWLIRFHPITSTRYDKQQMVKKLLQQGVSNYEITYSTSCPLYAILKKCSHHLTPCSSVYVEALQFKVPTTIIHPYGAECFEEDLKKGVVSYADNAATLLKAIETGFTNTKLDPETYINTQESMIESAVKVVLKE